jgi:hypothetical protein
MRKLAIAGLLALMAASALTSASPAAASSASLEFCCGWVKNNSGRATITVMRDWCTDGDYLVGSRPCKNSSYLTLLPGQSTSSAQDWDGVGIGGNCYGHVVKYTADGQTKTLDVPIDRRNGRPAMWVRVHDNENAFAAQTC